MDIPLIPGIPMKISPLELLRQNKLNTSNCNFRTALHSHWNSENVVNLMVDGQVKWIKHNKLLRISRKVFLFTIIFPEYLQIISSKPVFVFKRLQQNILRIVWPFYILGKGEWLIFTRPQRLRSIHWTPLTRSHGFKIIILMIKSKRFPFLLLMMVTSWESFSGLAVFLGKRRKYSPEINSNTLE